METGRAEAHAGMIVRLGAHVAFIHSHSLKASMDGEVGMEESQAIHPAMPGPLGKVKACSCLIVMWYPQLLPLASKPLSQKPGPSPTFLHAPATIGLVLIPHLWDYLCDDWTVSGLDTVSESTEN